ncbi:hypothetical protein [Lacticaseibacillus saniviri]|uniref:Surface layer protein A domain-containing protein n=1 Tax=Lacticaseibacillus saniviri JCM 17471 = DSM 24301 TaxID=1293598 RepID=A0A0R2MZR0_9LACO|nr:hypothetical protein [Lacticaseibacillus saniviri]KRO18921.1 hypothetical protein IV56_GL000073 [Lacticaseibacillus saniviri JCM 17471 = DSM 24301]
MKKLSALLVGAAILGGFALAPTVNPQAANTGYNKIKGSLSALNVDLKVTVATPAKKKVQTYTAKGKPSKVLPANTRWNMVGEQLVGKNDVRYDLGGGYWVKATSVTPSITPVSLFKNFKTTTFVAGGNGAMIEPEIGGVAGTRILRAGSQWKYYQKVYHNHNLWYNLGGNQWTTSFNSFE